MKQEHIEEFIANFDKVELKSLPESMIHVPHLSGCTILGDGSVGLILDATSLSNLMKIKPQSPVESVEV